MEPPARISLKALSLGRGGVKAPLKPCREMVPCTVVEHRQPTHRASSYARAESAFVRADVYVQEIFAHTHMLASCPSSFPREAHSDQPLSVSSSYSVSTSGAARCKIRCSSYVSCASAALSTFWRTCGGAGQRTCQARKHRAKANKTTSSARESLNRFVSALGAPAFGEPIAQLRRAASFDRHLCTP